MENDSLQVGSLVRVKISANHVLNEKIGLIIRKDPMSHRYPEFLKMVHEGFDYYDLLIDDEIHTDFTIRDFENPG